MIVEISIAYFGAKPQEGAPEAHAFPLNFGLTDAAIGCILMKNAAWHVRNEGVKMNRKMEIREKLSRMIQENRALAETLTDKVSLTDYAHLVRPGNIWTDALQAALDEHECIEIPAADMPYMIDGTVTIPSNRHIEAADGAVIRQAAGVRVLMLRNEHTQDGTHAPIAKENRDCNISINGGRWEESWTKRLGYRRSGMYDMDASHFFGVSTCMLFNNMDHLTLTNMTFYHTAGFSVQMGDVADVHCEEIAFVECFADGIHVNGNVENLVTRSIHGQVGDDLVALNMFDWQNSSVNFGPMRTVLCENLEAAAGKGYKAMRLQPAVYYYDDGSAVDCSLNDAVISNVSGIKTFKMYYQTPAYNVDTQKPEKGSVGSGDNIFFENLTIDLDMPCDKFKPYLESDPVTGSFAALEINANIGRLSLENVDLKLYDHFPMSFLIAVGPKSVRRGTGEQEGKIEVFDPYVGCEVGVIELKNITINGIKPDDITPYIHEIVFDHLYDDAPSTARGSVREIIYRKDAP